MTGPADQGAPSPAPDEGRLGAALVESFTFTADWPERAADRVDLLVAVVNDKAVRPVVIAARALVFGFVIGVVFAAVTVLFCVAALRLLDVYVFPGRIWASYFVLGGALVLLGFGLYLVLSRRQAAVD